MAQDFRRRGRMTSSMAPSGEFAGKRARICSNTSRCGKIGSGGTRPLIIYPPPSRKKNDSETQLYFVPRNRVNPNFHSTRPLPNECSIPTVRTRRVTLAALVVARPL